MKAGKRTAGASLNLVLGEAKARLNLWSQKAGSPEDTCDLAALHANLGRFEPSEACERVRCQIEDCLQPWRQQLVSICGDLLNFQGWLEEANALAQSYEADAESDTYDEDYLERDRERTFAARALIQQVDDAQLALLVARRWNQDAKTEKLVAGLRECLDYVEGKAEVFLAAAPWAEAVLLGYQSLKELRRRDRELADTLDLFHAVVEYARQEELEQAEAARGWLSMLETSKREEASGWGKQVGSRLLDLIAGVPEEFALALETAARAIAPPTPLGRILQLPILEPSHGAVERLAAATGDGLAEQVLRQDNPPVEIHLVQFGRQLRVAARVLDAKSPYTDCWAQLEFLEGDRALMKRNIRVTQGQGQCALTPQETATLRPQSQSLVVKFLPMITLQQVAEAGSEAYTPKLGKLLHHENPQIRQLAVEVLARISGPSARELIQPLAADHDETVRTAVQRALKQMPQSRGEGTAHEPGR